MLRRYVWSEAHTAEPNGSRLPEHLLTSSCSPNTPSPNPTRSCQGRQPSFCAVKPSNTTASARATMRAAIPAFFTSHSVAPIPDRTSPVRPGRVFGAVPGLPEAEPEAHERLSARWLTLVSDRADHGSEPAIPVQGGHYGLPEVLSTRRDAGPIR